MSRFDAFARYYDADFGGYVADIPFYRELARRVGDPVLELMCGSGRVLLPLAQAGLRVTGVDVAPALLARARTRIEAAGLSDQVGLYHADVRVDLPPGPFALVIIALNSFMHLESEADQLATLRRIHGVLRRGGLLAIDLFNPDPRELLRHNSQLVLDKIFTLDDGVTIQKFVVQSVDLAAQVIDVTFLYDEQDAEGQVRRTVLPFTMRWLYRYELEHVLARAGFAVEAVYGSYDLEEYGSASELLLTVARRL